MRLLRRIVLGLAAVLSLLGVMVLWPVLGQVFDVDPRFWSERFDVTGGWMSLMAGMGLLAIVWLGDHLRPRCKAKRRRLMMRPARSRFVIGRG